MSSARGDPVPPGREADLKSALDKHRQWVEAELSRALPPESAWPEGLHRAMRYSLFAGGKRVRPLLVVAASEAVGGSREDTRPLACAVEMVHTYSLIHDDLPAMDDDDLRRGKPTVHIAYDEATAILAADALVPLAFAVVADLESASTDARTALVRLIASACGSVGMTGGQSIDLAAEGNSLTAAELEHMYSLKTGALIHASIVSACLLCDDLTDDQFAALDRFGRDIGVAFQIQDDILDIEGETHEIGKPSGSDQKLDKATYPALFGVEASRARCDELLQSALAQLGCCNKGSGLLEWLARFIVERKT